MGLSGLSDRREGFHAGFGIQAPENVLHRKQPAGWFFRLRRRGADEDEAGDATLGGRQLAGHLQSSNPPVAEAAQIKCQRGIILRERIDPRRRRALDGRVTGFRIAGAAGGQPEDAAAIAERGNQIAVSRGDSRGGGHENQRRERTFFLKHADRCPWSSLARFFLRDGFWRLGFCGQFRSGEQSLINPAGAGERPLRDGNGALHGSGR